MNREKNYKIWWDGKNKVARAWARGIVDVNGAEALLQATKEMAENYGGKVDWVLDLSEIEKPSPKSRRILAEATAHPGVHKYALVGASVFLRIVSNFITAASGQKNARHFATEAEALQWIRKEK